MADCPQRYKSLPCSLTGIGYTADILTGNTTTVRLRQGHGGQFPALAAGEYFYAWITDGCDECCEQVLVTGRNADTLTIERPERSCACFSTNSRVSYTLCSVAAVEAIARGVGLNVADPLIWDCNTRTLSIDCAKLQAMVNDPCTAA